MTTNDKNSDRDIKPGNPSVPSPEGAEHAPAVEFGEDDDPPPGYEVRSIHDKHTGAYTEQAWVEWEGEEHVYRSDAVAEAWSTCPTNIPRAWNRATSARGAGPPSRSTSIGRERPPLTGSRGSSARSASKCWPTRASPPPAPPGGPSEDDERAKAQAIGDEFVLSGVAVYDGPTVTEAMRALRRIAAKGGPST
jgi:hypothetical protein